VLTGKRGDPTFEYREAAKQVRGTTKGLHKNGAKEPKLYYFIYAHQAAGLARHLAGDTGVGQKQSDAVIEKLDGRKENNKEAALKLKEVQALKKLEVKKRKTHARGEHVSTKQEGERGEGGANEREIWVPYRVLGWLAKSGIV
jgi:hypothetical protein